MCSCGPPPPVFMKPRDWPSLFLDDLVGRQLADDIRSLFGRRLYDDGPYGMVCSCGGDSYLAASLSSVWALLVFLVAFGAGLAFRSKKRVAWWMLGSAATVSLLDIGVRVVRRLEHPAPYRDLMLDRLPEQIIANAIFQFALPFVAGLALALDWAGLKSLLRAGRALLSVER